MGVLPKILAWAWVGIALIFALAASVPPQQIISAAVMFTISALLALPLQELSNWWKASSLKVIPRPALSAVAGVAAIFLIGSNAAQPAAESEASVNAPVSPAPPSPTPTAPDLTGPMIEFYKSVVDTAKVCDGPATDMAQTAEKLGSGGASIYDAAIAARTAERGCEESMLAFMQMVPPQNFTGAAKDHAQEALDRCGTGVMLKHRGAKMLQDIYDGETQPSKLADFKETADQAGVAQLACVGSLFQTASSLNVDLSKMPGIAKD